MSVVGWAVDADLRSSVDEIVVFVSGEAVHHRPRFFPRDDVRKGYPLVQNSGFRVIVPIAEDSLEGDTDIRVFGISRGGVAGELNYTPTFNSLRESLALRHINATTTGLL